MTNWGNLEETDMICSSLRTAVRHSVGTLPSSSPGTYTNCCRQPSSTPPTQSYSCSLHIPQTRKEDNDASWDWSTSAPAWHDMGLTQHGPNTPLRRAHRQIKYQIMDVKLKAWDFLDNIKGEWCETKQHKNEKCASEAHITGSYLELLPQLIQWWWWWWLSWQH